MWYLFVIYSIIYLFIWFLCSLCIHFVYTWISVHFDPSGFDMEGYNEEGFNRYGYDRDGYDLEGFNLTGYSRIGEFDGIIEYDKHGFDADGFNRWIVHVLYVLYRYLLFDTKAMNQLLTFACSLFFASQIHRHLTYFELIMLGILLWLGPFSHRKGLMLCACAFILFRFRCSTPNFVWSYGA